IAAPMVRNSTVVGGEIDHQCRSSRQRGAVYAVIEIKRECGRPVSAVAIDDCVLLECEGHVLAAPLEVRKIAARRMAGAPGVISVDSVRTDRQTHEAGRENDHQGSRGGESKEHCL